MTEYPTDAELAQAKDMPNRITIIYQAKVVRQGDLRTALATCLLTGGHVLVGSVPGLAKTTAAQTLVSAVSGAFHRIQYTPDLIPNDIVGSQIQNQASGEMVTQPGPVHTNLVPMDKINRPSAKTQSAMLEAMQEEQTTIDGVNHRLPRPFMVMAIQNPIEEGGIYVLPETQMSRSLLKEIITYSAPVKELEVLGRIDSKVMNLPTSSEPVSITGVLLLQDLTQRIYVHGTLEAYIIDIINTMRSVGPNPLPGWIKHVRVGASLRSAIALMQIPQALALMDGRSYVVPDDIKKLRYGILRRRVIRTFNALANNVSVEELIDVMFDAASVP